MQDIAVVYHSRMLQDSERLKLYKNAIETLVKEDDIVVDIGTGSGILAAYAANRTQKNVYAIEYFDFAAEMAETLIRTHQRHNINLIKSRSYDIDLKEQNPSIIITETIGQIGPEENIVELCYDFIKRHPSIQKMVPCQLSLYAQIIESEHAKHKIDHYLEGFNSASSSNYNYKNIESLIQDALANIIFQTNLSDAKKVGEPILLAKYVLGKTQDPSFVKKIPIKEPKNYFVHLYFEAQLTDQIILSSRYDQNNHWEHSFLCLPNHPKTLTLSYMAGSNVVTALWN